MTSILVVEDEPGVRQTIVDWLQSEGYLVLEAGSQAEALTVFGQAEPRPAAALVDVKLPDGNGFVLADLLHQRFGFENLIFITAFFWEEETRRQLARRGRPYFEKPLKFQDQILPFLKRYLASQV